MSKMENKKLKVGNVPNLRFKEFEGEWESKRLGEIADKVNTKNKVNKVNLVFSNSAVQGIVLQNEYFDKSIANKDNLTEYYIIKPFDFVYNPRISSNAQVGAMNVNKTKKTGLVSPLYTVFRINDNSINISFLEIMFKSKVWHNYMRSIANYGARDDRMNIKSDEFFALPIKTPSNKEQKKIADFLSLIDERITTQNKIIGELNVLKTNIAKRIFSQQLRFKDDNESDFPEWNEVKIVDILKIGSGKDYKHLQKGNIPVFGTGGFMTSVDDYLYDGETVCIGRKGTIDKPMYHNGKIWTVDTLFYTHSFQFCIPKFIFQVFLTIDWLEFNEASGVPSLSKNTIEKIRVQIPSLEEQNIISKFLSSIDTKIDIENQLLKKLEEQKKFLLQNLFV